jgi:hypothetical protein
MNIERRAWWIKIVELTISSAQPPGYVPQGRRLHACVFVAECTSTSGSCCVVETGQMFTQRSGMGLYVCI